MSAAELRQAASLMRERAGSASRWDGMPWFAVSGSVYGGTAAPHQVIAPAITYYDDADHIASWHPTVALAVADWLDATARELESLYDPPLDHPLDGRRTAGLTVARAYLGTSP